MNKTEKPAIAVRLDNIKVSDIFCSGQNLVEKLPMLAFACRQWLLHNVFLLCFWQCLHKFHHLPTLFFSSLFCLNHIDKFRLRCCNLCELKSLDCWLFSQFR